MSMIHQSLSANRSAWRLRAGCAMAWVAPHSTTASMKNPRNLVVSLSCCDALHSILETGVRWYAVGQGTLPAPDTRATHPSSRHDLSDLLPSLGSRVAMYAVSQLHGSAPALVTVLASPGAVAPDGNTPMTTTISPFAISFRSFVNF